MTESERQFADRAVRRKTLFLGLSIVGIAVAVVLAVYYAYRWWSDPGYAVGIRAVVVVLILLNARQNLRQYRYAAILEKSSVAATPVP